MARASRHGIRDIVTQALRDKGRNQEWLGERIATIERRDEPYSQSQVSAWMHGRVPLNPTQAFAMERALGFKPGQLTRHLGYVPADADAPDGVEAAIAADARLSKRDRRVLVALYRELLSP